MLKKNNFIHRVLFNNNADLIFLKIAIFDYNNLINEILMIIYNIYEHQSFEKICEKINAA